MAIAPTRNNGIYTGEIDDYWYYYLLAMTNAHSVKTIMMGTGYAKFFNSQ
jgi:hypothetical protein